MKGTLSHELEVEASADNLWEIYRGLKLAKLVCELVPNVVEKVQLIEGDGGEGTVLEVFFPKGTPLLTSYKEKFTEIDDKKRLKAAEVVEGGLLNFGFSLYRVTFEIIEKGTGSSIIRSIVDYEVDDKSAENASFVTMKPLEVISQAIGGYVTKIQPN